MCRSLLPRSLYPNVQSLNDEQCAQVANFALQSLIKDFWEPAIEQLLDITSLLAAVKDKCLGLYEVLYGGDYLGQVISNYVASSDETRYGNWLQAVGEHIAFLRFGNTFVLAGLDYSFLHHRNSFNLEIKTGHKWGNATGWKQLRRNFENAEKQCIEQGNNPVNILAHAGMPRQRKVRKDFGCHWLIEGPSFWEFQSGIPDFFNIVVYPIQNHGSLASYRMRRENLLRESIAKAA
jgi:hypothetical protein